MILSAGVFPANVIQTSIPSFPGKDILYVDFYAQPTAENDIGQSTTFDVGGARFAFVLSGSKADGMHATLEAFNGDGQGGGSWTVNRSDVLLYDGVSPGWVELSVRLNYSTKTWDLYLNQRIVAADLALVDKGSASLASFAVTGDVAHDSFIDQIYIGSANPLFQDFNNDGIDDLWEINYGLSLTANDRNLDLTGNGLTVLNAYVEGASPNDFFQQQLPVITLITPGGAVGPDGLVLVKVTNIYGNIFTNGTVDLAALLNTRLSADPGRLAGLVQTNSSGVAEAYLAEPAAKGPYSIDSSQGLPVWWQNLYFGAAGQSPDANPSGDGMSNWYKYQMGLNPNINEDASDLDGDGVSNDQDARPSDSSVGILQIQITVPANGGTAQ